MRMADWITKLDDFLRLSERDILRHSGKVSHEQAVARAHAEYEKFRLIEANKPSPVEQDFDEAVRRVKLIGLQPPSLKPERENEDRKGTPNV